MDRRSSGELVAAHIRRMVFEGAYRPGERIRQDEIAAQLGVSRIPVREAIIALEREGWVTVEPHRGAFVNGLDADFIRDHFELHAAISGVTATRVVERADDEALAAVLTAARAVLDCDPTDTEAFNHAVYAFVDEVDRAAAAPRLSSMTRVMANLVPGNFFAEVPGTVETQREGLAAIASALERRDAAAAVEAYEELLHRHGEALVAELERRHVITEPAAAPTG